MTWYVLAVVVGMGHVFQRQANGIDRPSFGATIIKTQRKHGLSELEQPWLVGNML